MRLAEGIAPSGHLFLTFLTNGGDDHLHRCLWFSNGNPHTQSQTHTVTSWAGCGPRSPLINSFDSHLDSCAFFEMPHALSGKMEPGGRKVKLFILPPTKVRSVKSKNKKQEDTYISLFLFLEGLRLYFVTDTRKQRVSVICPSPPNLPLRGLLDLPAQWLSSHCLRAQDQACHNSGLCVFLP